jgi:hypothetical protein
MLVYNQNLVTKCDNLRPSVRGKKKQHTLILLGEEIYQLLR